MGYLCATWKSIDYIGQLTISTTVKVKKKITFSSNIPVQEHIRSCLGI